MLWQYYKGTEEYAKAAKLLYELATKKARSTNIEKKLEFLSHALICINSAPESQPNVQLKANIRDWLDVARVQLQAQQQLRAEAGHRLDPRVVEETIHELDNNLMTVSDLFELANRFDLPTIKLAVIHCAGHYDTEMIEGIYKSIIHEGKRVLKDFSEAL
uniref:Nucleoporin_C domain-containing protein n=1 Tax=Bursaphelenchus xylophilus TaxID=6326 RepID=A0A1I7SNH1_BURXY